MTYLALRRPSGNPFRFYNAPFALQRVFTPAKENKWMPSTDISETDGSFEVRAELPGVTKDDVQISVKDGLLTIKGEKRQEKVDDIKAEFNDGVLTLSIPKPEEAKPKEIPISVESSVDSPQEN